jgi:hypothetical protein
MKKQFGSSDCSQEVPLSKQAEKGNVSYVDIFSQSLQANVKLVPKEG